MAQVLKNDSDDVVLVYGVQLDIELLQVVADETDAQISLIALLAVLRLYSLDSHIKNAGRFDPDHLIQNEKQCGQLGPPFSQGLFFVQKL